MTVHDLIGLVRAAQEGDPASLAPLADALAEADGPGRLALLSRWLDGWRRAQRLMKLVDHLRKQLEHGLTASPGMRTLHSRQMVRGQPGSAYDHVGVAASRMRERLGSTLIDAIEDGRWYAVRIDRTDEKSPCRPLGPYGDCTEVNVRLAVNPLDGGRIDFPPEG